MARTTQSLLSTMTSLVRILKEHRESNPIEMERLRKMLEDKEVELVEWVKEIDRLTQRESNLQARLQSANDLLLQWERELKAERQRAEKDALKRKKVEEML